MIFKILSREMVQQYNVDRKHIVISFRDPDMEKAELPITDLRLGELFLSCHDLDAGDNFELFTEELAVEVIEFVNKHIKEIELIIVNCEAGVSRSSGCAAALCKLMNGSDDSIFNHPSLLPNMLIYRLILNSKKSLNRRVL